MALFEFAPHPALQPLIRTYRVVEFAFAPGVELPFKPYPPKAEHCLSLYPRDREKVVYASSGKTTQDLDAVVIGHPSEVTNRYVGRNFLVFQVVFGVGGLYRLTGIPSWELTNQYLDARTVFDPNIGLLLEQLAEAADHQQMVTRVNEFLLGKLERLNKPALFLDTIVTQWQGHLAGGEVSQLAHNACMSMRQFQRVFQDRMGVSPKFYCKVLRFENAFRLRNLESHSDWNSIAWQCGYQDYQHLSKDYQQLTGMTPVQFHQLEAKAPERHFGKVDTY